MLRSLVAFIYSVTRITPDRIIMFFIIVGSVVVFEVGSHLLPWLIRRIRSGKADRAENKQT